MGTINPPVALEDPSNKELVEYIQNVASKPDFDYPQVFFRCLYRILFVLQDMMEDYTGV